MEDSSTPLLQSENYVICEPQDVRCSTPLSWQGSPLRAPVASLRPWLFEGIEPIQSHQNVSPFHYSRETSLSLHPSILSGRSRAIAPLETYSQDLEICLSTCTEPCTNDWPFDHQSGEPSSSPDTPMRTSSRPTLRGLDAAIRPKMDHVHEPLAARKPRSLEVGFFAHRKIGKREQLTSAGQKIHHSTYGQCPEHSETGREFVRRTRLYVVRAKAYLKAAKPFARIDQ